MTISPIWFSPVLLLGSLPLIAAVVRWFLSERLRKPHGTSRCLRVTETLALDPKRRVHLLECQGRRVLLLTGSTQDLVVGWLPDA